MLLCIRHILVSLIAELLITGLDWIGILFVFTLRGIQLKSNRFRVWLTSTALIACVRAEELVMQDIHWVVWGQMVSADLPLHMHTHVHTCNYKIMVIMMVYSMLRIKAIDSQNNWWSMWAKLSGDIPPPQTEVCTLNPPLMPNYPDPHVLISW